MLEERAYRLMTVAKELEIDLIVLAQMNRVGMDAHRQDPSPYPGSDPRHGRPVSRQPRCLDCAPGAR